MIQEGNQHFRRTTPKILAHPTSRTGTSKELHFTVLGPAVSNDQTVPFLSGLTTLQRGRLSRPPFAVSSLAGTENSLDGNMYARPGCLLTPQ